uniref:RanBP2-type domain-containing protein n=1 Tax=Brassica campestris TaxID=3711 RepID=M4DXL3_BRACM
MANFGEGRRRGTGGMLPLLAISTVAEYYRLPWKPPVTAGLLAANTLVYLRPAFLDPLIPHISEVWFNPNLILKHKDLKRFFLSALYHLNEPHLVYNMMSLLWKGIKLETSMGSTQFASMVVTLLGMSQGVTLLLAKSLHVLFDYRRAYYHEYSVGFSGVLFALKVVLNAQAEDYTSVYGVLVPTKYAAWAELVLVQMFVPRASFLGHLGGILAGILYMKMKRSYSGSDHVAMVVRGVARAVTWPLRFVSSMVGSRRRRITGRGRVGRGQNGIAGPGIWRCQPCTFDNSGWERVCEMCGSGRSRGNGWSVNQGQAHSSSSSSDLPLDELRRRRTLSPEGEPVKELYVCVTLTLVLAASFVTDTIGIHALFGAFVVAIVTPKEDLYFASSALKTDVTTIRGAQSWGLLLLVILTTCFGKIGGTVVASLLCKVPFREAMSLGVLMNTKGLVELIVLKIGKDQKVLNDQAFAILAIMALVTTFITTPLLMAIYKPARRGAPYKHRTIQRKDHDSELRILACFNSTRNIPTLINMIESSRGTGQRGQEDVDYEGSSRDISDSTV